MAFELPAWLNQSNTDLIPNAIAKGTQAGATIASGIRANRQQALDERQRELSNDIRRKEVSALLTWRQAQASKETAKLEAAAEKAASEKMFWDVVGTSMDQWRLANPGAPMDKEAEAFQSLVRNNWHMRGSGQAIPAPLLKAPPPPKAEPTEFSSAGQDFVTGPNGQILQVRPTPAPKDNRTVTQKDVDASIAADNEAEMKAGRPPRNPAEEAAKKAELLSAKVTGRKKDITTAAEENLATAEQLKKDFESATPENRDHAQWMFESFSRMAHITSDSKQSVEQKLKVADALGQIRALRANDALFNKPGASQLQIDAIIKQFSGDPEKPSSSTPEKKFKFEFKGDRLQSVK